MFLSQAGAQPRMWEASPSEHKKWVEVGVQRAESRTLTGPWGSHFHHPAWPYLGRVAQIRTVSWLMAEPRAASLLDPGPVFWLLPSSLFSLRHRLFVINL